VARTPPPGSLLLEEANVQKAGLVFLVPGPFITQSWFSIQHLDPAREAPSKGKEPEFTSARGRP
jgi:hypothetical protein